MQVPGVPQASGQQETYGGLPRGGALGRNVCVCVRERACVRIRDKRAQMGVHSLAWTQLGIAARGIFGSPIPPGGPARSHSSAPQALGTPQLLLGWGYICLMARC